MKHRLITTEQGVKKALESCGEHEVFCYFSTENYLLSQCEKDTVLCLEQSADIDVTRIDGPVPDMGEVIAAAGAISFFSTKRVVQLINVEITAMSDAYVKELCDVMQTLESAVIVMTCIFKDEKAKTTKKAKMIADTAQSVGFVADLKKPTAQDAAKYAQDVASGLGARLSRQDATTIVTRAGAHYPLIKSEVEKLSAAVKYGEITHKIITEMGVQNIDENVFDMVREVTSGNVKQALNKLGRLLDLQNEPIAITAALSGSYIDIYRAKCAQQKGKGYKDAHRDFVYKGSDYRIKMAAQSAGKYTKKRLVRILNLLCALDLKLKSSPADKNVLLQTAICEIAQLGGKNG